jgi:DNA repair exonuclease SbcCD ATPase subunit
MFTQLQLTNFQCHNALEVPLSRITTICGESDSGKSAIIRALCWLLYNNLQGDSFITHGQTTCKVALDIDNEGKLIRHKTTKSNGYTLPDGSICNAIGRDIPESVAQLIRVSDLNVQYQFDAPFWFSLSAGQLTKELNLIADIAWLDRLMYQSNADKREIQTVLNVSNTRQTELKTKLEALQWTHEAENELNKLELQEKNLQKLQNTVETLNNLLSVSIIYIEEYNTIIAALESWQQVNSNYTRLQEIKEQTTRLNTLIDNAPVDIPNVTELQTKYTGVYNIYTQYSALSELLSKTPEAIPDVTQLNTELVNTINLYDSYIRLENVLSKVPEAIPDVTQLSSISELSELYNVVNSLTTFVTSYDKVEVASKKIETELGQMHALYKEQNVCPVCGGSL